MKRILTAVVVAPLVVYAVGWGHFYFFLAVVSTVALLCYYEYAEIVAAYGIGKPGPLGYAAGLAVLLVPREPEFVIVLAALFALVLGLTGSDLAKGLPRAAALLFGVVYIFGSWRIAILLRERSPWWLLFALLLNWLGDSAAYYIGSRVGRHKMAPTVSPKKSWEGAVASLVASTIFAALYLPRLIPAVTLGPAIILGVAGNFAGQVGDLAESALKRGAGVKDSGTMLPGHGGWLDRVDSVLFALPMIYALLRWVT
ncbi:MAG TPA: phosphatidate cytidylyltransferase [Bryobacteraceae bacterium]|nr:phosphatidate cytidylyltransferase [Bryobacteraceae bacterium]